MSFQKIEIITSVGPFDVFGDGVLNCHHFHSGVNLPESERTSEHNFRISLWGCNIIGSELGQNIFGYLKNGKKYDLGILKFISDSRRS